MNCEKIIIKTDEYSPSKTLLGIITNRQDNYIEFQTSTKTYRWNNKIILSIESTDIPFKNNKEDLLNKPHKKDE